MLDLRFCVAWSVVQKCQKYEQAQRRSVLFAYFLCASTVLAELTNLRRPTAEEVIIHYASSIRTRKNKLCSRFDRFEFVSASRRKRRGQYQYFPYLIIRKNVQMLRS